MFKCVQLGPNITGTASQNMFTLVHYAACTSVRKQAAGIWLKWILLTICQQSCRKVIFSVVYVCTWRDPMWPLPMMHWASLYKAHGPCAIPPLDMEPPSAPIWMWDLSVQVPQFPLRTLHSSVCRLPPLDRGPYHQVPPTGTDIWMPRLETCSNLFTLDPHQCWYLVAIK